MTGAPRACACRCSSAESATGGAVARAAGPDGRRAGRGRLREAPAGGSGGGRGRPRGIRLRDLNENVTTRPPAATPSGPPLTPPTRGSRRDAVRRFGDPSLQIITVGDPVDRKSAVEVLVHEGRITGPGGLVPGFRVPNGGVDAWGAGRTGTRCRPRTPRRRRTGRPGHEAALPPRPGETRPELADRHRVLPAASGPATRPIRRCRAPIGAEGCGIAPTDRHRIRTTHRASSPPRRTAPWTTGRPAFRS